MSTHVTCPKCSGLLKMSRLPATDTPVQCPRCGQPFVLAGEEARQAIVAPGKILPPSFGIALGLILILLLIGGGVTMALMFSASKVSTVSVPPRPPIKQPDIPKEDAPPPKPVPEEDVKAPEDRLQDFVSLMIKGGVAEESKRFEDAAAAYGDALKIKPDDAQARQKLQEIQAIVVAQAADRKDADKLKTELSQLLGQADKAMSAKQCAAAMEIYKLALQKSPADAAAVQGLIAAQDAVARDQAEQKKLTDFQNHIATGKAHMTAGRYAEAIREFLSAQQLLPNNAEATQLQRQAEQQLAALQNQDERKKQYQRLVDQATAALRGGRFSEAELVFRQALQLMPNDALANDGLTQAQRGLQAAKVEFQNYLNRGSQAAREGRFQDAANAYREAVRLFPADEVATKLLRDTEAAYEKQATYDQAMRLAVASMLNMRYGDAMAAYAQALKAIPSDPLAAKGLLEARQYYQVETQNKLEFERLVQTGLFANKLQKYAEAHKAFSDALQLMPNHPQALAAQQQARYSEAMAKGQQAMNMQRYAEAMQHFQLALQAIPNDFAALAALTRARSLNR